MPAHVFKVNLKDCIIGDQGCKYLVSGLSKFLDKGSEVTTLLIMKMENNAIQSQGVRHLSKLLQLGCVVDLDLAAHDNSPTAIDRKNCTPLIGKIIIE